jgi:glycosyltransferase involved in cell wall biosynthesis
MIEISNSFTDFAVKAAVDSDRDQTIRVAMIIHDFLPLIGGAERQLAAIAPLLKMYGFDVHIITRCYPGLPPFERFNGIPVYRLRAPGPKAAASLIFTMEAIKLLGKLRPHLIHSFSLLSPTTAAVTAKRLFGTPVVVKVVGLGDIARMERKTLGKYRTGQFRRYVDTFVAVSHQIDEELAKLGVPLERRLFLPNGVDTERFAPISPEEKSGLRKSLGLPDGPIAVYVGRLTPGKNVNLLLSAWPQVRRAHPRAMLIIIGTGGEEAALRNAAGAGVQFTGNVENVLPYLQAADLFVLPSASEGLSNALLEALSTGLPVVATAIGGSIDVIEHGKNGWLVRAGDLNELREAIVMLLNNKNARASLAASARQHILERYGLQAVASRHSDLYLSLLERQ